MAVCGTLTNISLSGLPSPAAAKLLPATTNLEKLTVKLVAFDFPLSTSLASHRDRGPFHLPHLREIKIDSYPQYRNNERLRIYDLFNAIDAPSLERIYAYHRATGPRDQWPAMVFASLLSRTRHSLAYLYIRWESSITSAGLLDSILAVHEIQSSLKTLIVWGAWGTVTDKTLKYLMVDSKSAEDDEDEESSTTENLSLVTFPTLHTLVLVDVVGQKCSDGLLAKTIRSRLENTDLKRVCLNLRLRVSKAAGQSQADSVHHALDEQLLLEMTEQGADIHVVRGLNKEVLGWLTGA